MNAILKAQNAYGAASRPLRSAKSVEYEAVARVTHRLKAAADRKDKDYRDFVAALQQNRKLWSIFATEVANPDNPLPAELKARIFYLAEFSRQFTSKVLSGEETVGPLLEVNMAILRGLQQRAV